MAITKVRAIFCSSRQREKKRSNFYLCIICQESDDKPLRKAQVSSIQNFLSAMELRRDDVFDRLEHDSPTLTDRQIVWHSCCYETYTSRQNLRYMVDQNCEQAKIPESTAKSVQRISFDWSKCFFCKNKTHKKDKKLINIAIFEACDSIKKAAEAKNDEEMLHILRSVKHLIAKYHKSCYGSYTSKSNLRFQVPRDKEETKHDKAFNDLISIITPKIEPGNAYDMNSLLIIFKGSLQSQDWCPISRKVWFSTSQKAQSQSSCFQAQYHYLMSLMLPAAYQPLTKQRECNILELHLLHIKMMTPRWSTLLRQ